MSDPLIVQTKPARNVVFSLPAPEEPASCEVFDRTGRVPVLPLCDHAARFLPRALGTLGAFEAARSG